MEQEYTNTHSVCGRYFGLNGGELWELELIPDDDEETEWQLVT